MVNEPIVEEIEHFPDRYDRGLIEAEPDRRCSYPSL
jgi:hypothetical protein